MQGTFHWLRVQVFCYATEDEELIGEAITRLVGTDEIDVEISEGEHGNRLLIFGYEALKQKDAVRLFGNLGKDVLDKIADDAEERVDDDCVLYLRFDKQELVQGRYSMVHHGDVLSVTGKVAAHPAKKEIAVRNLLQFLDLLRNPR